MDGRREDGPSLRQGRGCLTCRNWLPHAHYPYIGFCTLWREITVEDHYCWKHERMRADEERYYWCTQCKTRLTREEAREHSLEGHRVYRGAYVDPDVIEEIYGVF